MKHDTPPMEALSVGDLPKGKNWVYEPKWDGFRCLAYKDAKGIDLRSKSGKPLNRYFPDIVAALQKIREKAFTLDGELIVMKDGRLSFSELQLRLHPSAKRVAMLSERHPAAFVVFDDLSDPGLPFAGRRASLETFIGKYGNDIIQLSPQTGSLASANKWLKSMRGTIDGIIAKDITLPYAPGERRMQKWKMIRTADCVVGGFRYASGKKEVGSLLLGLYDNEGLLHHVGFTSNIPKSERAALTRKLEKLVAAPGFTGKAPGGPSRWSNERSAQWKPLKPKLVVEVSYDHVSDDRFRHGTSFIRWRPDKAPRQCKMEQIA